MRILLGALVVACALAAPAQAEIFRCVGADGAVRFTGDASKCPNAAPHAPKAAALQRVGKTPAPLTSARTGGASKARRSRAAAPDASAAAEAAWRQKKAEADRSVRALEMTRERIVAAVHWCNKGHGVTAENPRTGLREPVKCSEIDEQRAQLQTDLERARSYQAGGLEEECRAAGCLPGWLR